MSLSMAERLEDARPSCRHCPERLEYDLEHNLWTCPNAPGNGGTLSHPPVRLAGELVGAMYADGVILWSEALDAEERAA